MAVIYTEHFAQFFDDNGDPLAGGKLYTYEAGTTTPKAAYTTSVGDVAHTNPIILDAAGRATIFIDGSYKFDLYDSNDVNIDVTDNVTSFISEGAQEIPTATAGGTADEITADYKPNITVADLVTVIFRASAANTTTTPTFSPDGATARTIVKNGGSSLSAGDIAGSGHSCLMQYDSSNTRWELMNPAQLPKSVGACRIEYSSGTELKLVPYFGNTVLIDGSFEFIDSAGITIANTGLTASTLYYVYVYMNSGTLTLELSETAPDDSVAYGIKIKTGDATRTLVGMIYTDGSSQFTNNNGDIANWFNRKPVAITGSFTTTRTTTATSFTEINSEIRTNFLSWGDAAQISFGDAITHNTTSAIGTTAIYLLTTNIISTSHLFVSGASNVNTSLSCAYEPSLGRSYATIFGKTTSGTLSYLSGATEVGHGRLTVLVNI